MGRKHDRIVIHKKGQVYESTTDKVTDIIIHDIMKRLEMYSMAVRFQEKTRNIFCTDSCLDLWKSIRIRNTKVMKMVQLLSLLICQRQNERQSGVDRLVIYSKV